MRIEFKDRVFKLWKYSVSHSTLLIRSPKNRIHKTNIDILFSGVRFIKFPNNFEGCVITSLLPTEDTDILKEIEGNEYNHDEIFVFRSNEKKFYIIASVFNIQENEKDLFED